MKNRAYGGQEFTFIWVDELAEISAPVPDLFLNETPLRKGEVGFVEQFRFIKSPPRLITVDLRIRDSLNFSNRPRQK